MMLIDEMVGKEFFDDFGQLVKVKNYRGSGTFFVDEYDITEEGEEKLAAENVILTIQEVRNGLR